MRRRIAALALVVLASVPTGARAQNRVARPGEAESWIAGSVGGAVTAGFLVIGTAIALTDFDHLGTGTRIGIILVAHAAAAGGGYLGYLLASEASRGSVDAGWAVGWTLLGTAAVALVGSIVGLFFDLAEPGGASRVSARGPLIRF